MITDGFSYLFRQAAFALLLISLLSLAGCNQHKEQREFEQQALRAPSGITETDFNGQVEGGSVDPDDWRISPFFQGLVEIEDPAFPNPALTTDAVTINIFITGSGQVNGVYLSVYNHISGGFREIVSEPGALETGSLPLQFNGNELSVSAGTSIGTYRVILHDNTFNTISYGDIELE